MALFCAYLLLHNLEVDVVDGIVGWDSVLLLLLLLL
jgi:hypothetical protein